VSYEKGENLPTSSCYGIANHVELTSGRENIIKLLTPNVNYS